MKSFFKSVYQFLPLIGILKVWRAIKRPSFYKYLSVKGNFRVFLEKDQFIRLHSKHDLYIEKEIFWNGLSSEFEPYSLEKWCHLSSEANVIFDIGANTGIFSILAGHYTETGSVHSFEPVPYNFNVLEKNLTLNSNLNIHLNKCALSNFEGQSSMHVKKGINYMNSLEGNRYSNQVTSEIKFKVLTLDSYVQQNNLQQVDLIKIDVEGHEESVLLGAEKTIKKFKPDIIIEVLDNNQGRTIQQFFSAINEYRYYLIDDHSNELILKPSIATSERTNFLITTSNEN